jgi:hypothetical protein
MANMRSLRFRRASSTVSPIRLSGGRGTSPVLLEQVHVLTGIKVSPVDLLLPGRSIGKCNQFHGFDAH